MIKTFLFLFIVCISRVISYSQTDLLPIDSLLALEEYKIYIHGPDQKLMVMNEDKSEYITDFSVVKRAVFVNCQECKDTFSITPIDFPNLISLKIDGQFYNELINVCKFTNLQHLNIMWLSSNEDWFGRYLMFFPKDFWNLKKLQILEIPADHVSDISENIGSLENLKVLQIKGFKLNAPLNLPWTMLQHKQFELLSIDSELINDSDDISLFREFANFKVIVLSNPLSLSEIIKETKTLKQNHKDSKRYEIKNRKLILKNDSLTLCLNFNDNGRLNGKSELCKNGKVIQKRNYKNGYADGKWVIKNEHFIERLKFKNGHAKGIWRYHRTHTLFGNYILKHKKRYGNFAIHPDYFGLFPSNYKYKNFNDMNYFEHDFD